MGNEHDDVPTGEMHTGVDVHTGIPAHDPFTGIPSAATHNHAESSATEIAQESVAPDLETAEHDGVLAFGGLAAFADEDSEHDESGYDDLNDELLTATGGLPLASRSRVEERHARARSKQRARGKVMALVGLLLVAVLVLVGWAVVRPVVSDALSGKDWTGDGTGSVVVQIHPGDGTATIASTLHAAGVVRSNRAFDMAAADNKDSGSIQPGYYQLRHQMKASVALQLLLNPDSRISYTVTIPEGTTAAKVEAKLSAVLHLSASAVTAAAATPATLGVPQSYLPSSGTLPSIEGFLFPNTYSFDPNTAAGDALSTMVSGFIVADKSINFAAGASALGLTPYQALIIASMIEGEAKFDEDRPKVARVILNRMAAGDPLGIDATSIYGAVLAGRDPSTLTYTEDDPYNTRNRTGLPPTPIDNPGLASLKAAITPAAGDWTHYVNGDAQGHLVFTDEAGFEAAREACVQNNWGCD